MLKKIIEYTHDCPDILTVAEAVEVLQASVSLMHSHKTAMYVVEKLVGDVIMGEFMESLMSTLIMNFYVMANKLSPEKVKEFAAKFGAETQQVKVRLYNPPGDKGGNFDA